MEARAMAMRRSSVEGGTTLTSLSSFVEHTSRKTKMKNKNKK
jgi:hypothetical protein